MVPPVHVLEAPSVAPASDPGQTASGSEPPLSLKLSLPGRKNETEIHQDMVEGWYHKGVITAGRGEWAADVKQRPAKL